MIIGPDLVDKEPSKVLCPQCFRRTHYALNTDRYVCPFHGPVVTSEVVEPDNPRGDRRHG